MARHKSRAFVLSAADYRETSKLLQLFCENEGRISVIARGLRSPKSKKAQLADAFNLLQVNYTLKDGATLGMLTGIEPEHLYSSLRTNLDAYALASYWFEILKVAGQARLAGHEIFQLTDQFLASLHDHPIRGGLKIRSLQLMLGLAQELGFGIQLFACGICGRPDDLRRFSIAAGTAVCSRCQPPVGRALVLPQALSSALETQFAQSDELFLTAAAAFLNLYNEFLSNHLDHRFTTFAFLSKVMQK